MVDAERSIKTIIVDGSAVARMAFADALAADPAIAVLSTAAEAASAIRKINETQPDVVLLDCETPTIDGLVLLRKILHHGQTSVIAVITKRDDNQRLAEMAKERGAAAVFCKPATDIQTGIGLAGKILCRVVKAVAGHEQMTSPILEDGAGCGEDSCRAPPPIGERIRQRLASHCLNEPPKKLSADVMLPPPTSGAVIPSTDIVVCMGASTGGTESLYEVLGALPEDVPGIVIVQHMPERFTHSFAGHLNQRCRIRVKEAEDGDPIVRGAALIAPGNRHTILCRNGTHYTVRVLEGPQVSRHRPSVDVLFRSAALEAGANAMGILMTGMGDDGARGLLEMRASGALTVAQDEASCIVFGMPKEAIARGAALRVVSLQKIAAEIVTVAQQMTEAAQNRMVSKSS